MIRPSNRMPIPQPPAIVDALRAAGCGIVRRRLEDGAPVMSPRLLLPPPDAVKAMVRRAMPRADGSPSLKSVLLATALVCGVSITDIKSERRHAKSVRARQIYFFVAQELTPRSLPAIGREAGNRDHSTVLHGVRKVTEKRAHFEPELSQILAHFPKDTP